MIKTTGMNTILAGLNKEVSTELTNVNFMNRNALDYGTSVQDDKNKGVEQITIASNVFSAINLLDDAEFAPIAKKAIEISLGMKATLNTGTYLGLFVEEIRADKVNMDFVTVSAEQEETIIAEIQSCDLDDVLNLRKIFADINDLFRMYQELTIDAAKKLYKITATFYNEIVKATSTMHIDHNFVNFADTEKFEINRNGKYTIGSDVKIGEIVEFRSDLGELKKVVFNDKISMIQDTVSKQFSDLVNVDLRAAYSSIAVSDDVNASFGLGSEFSLFAKDMYAAIRKPYSTITAWKVQEEKVAKDQLAKKKVSPYAANKRLDEIKGIYNTEIEKLSNLARFLTKDLEMALAGRLMFMISNIKREKTDWVVDNDSTNQLFLAVAPELFLAYIVAEHAEIKVCGYKVLGNTDSLVEGQSLTFVDGNAMEVENVYVDSIYSGVLNVQVIDEVLCVVKPIEIERIEGVVPSDFVVEIYENSVIDAVHFAKTREAVKTSSFNTLTAQNVLSKAERVQVVPCYTYTDGKGKERQVWNAIVATISSVSDPNVKFEIPVAQYLCNSATMEKFIAGITAKSFGRTMIKGKTMRVMLSYDNIQEVEMNHAKEEVDINCVAGINNDPFAAVETVKEEVVNDNPFAAKSQDTQSNIEDEAFSSGDKVFDMFDDENAEDTERRFDEVDFSIFD